MKRSYIRLHWHSDWYRARVTLWFIAEFINQWDKDMQSIAEKTTEDYHLQDLMKYLWSIICRENNRKKKDIL